MERRNNQSVIISSPASEKFIIGCVLLGDEYARMIIPCMKAEYFYSSKYRNIFSHVRKMLECNKPVDPFSLYEELKDRAGVSPVALSELTDLSMKVPSAVNYMFHVNIVIEKYRLRELATLGIILQELTYSEDSSAVMNIALKNMKELSTGTFVEDITISAVGRELIKEIESPQRDVHVINTRIRAVDRIFNGFTSGSLTVIGARPSTGKSTLIRNIAFKVCRKNKPLVFTLEDTTRSFIYREINTRKGIDLFKYPVISLTDEQHADVIKTIADIASEDLFISSSSRSIGDIKMRSMLAVNEFGVDIIFIDYLGLITIAGKPENRNIAIGDIMSNLKSLAVDANIPVVVASQLSRAAAERRPQLYDLRDSGNIEQDADNVFLLHRNGNAAEIIIAKQRNGKIGTVDIHFDKERGKFTDIEPAQDRINPNF